jgi:hypothetical protein
LEALRFVHHIYGQSLKQQGRYTKRTEEMENQVGIRGIKNMGRAGYFS